MEKLKSLIQPNVYTVKEMEKMNWSEPTIVSYCRYRKELWKKATTYFFRMFKNVDYIVKAYDHEEKTMEVIVYNKRRNIICKSKNNDPVYALVECAEILENDENYINVVFKYLKI